MSAVQVVLGVATALLTVVAVVLVTRTVARMVAIIRVGQPDGTRTGPFGPRLKTMLVETLGHTRMLKWSLVGVAHWFVMVGFGALFLTLVEAYGEVWNPRVRAAADRPLGACTACSSRCIGGRHGARASWCCRSTGRWRTRAGRGGRRGSPARTMWQAYFVEAVVFVDGRGDPADPRAQARERGAGRTGVGGAGLDGDRVAAAGAPVLVSVFATVEDHHLDGVADRDRAEPDDGRGLAPVPGVLQHLLQARRTTGAHGARRAASR